jgi:hypothetical protein
VFAWLRGYAPPGQDLKQANRRMSNGNKWSTAGLTLSVSLAAILEVELEYVVRGNVARTKLFSKIPELHI